MGLLKKVKIGEVLIDNNVFLAPLAGIGDRSFRVLHKRFGAGLTFTEMVSAHGIVNENRKTLDLLQLTKKERPAGIQIFGSWRVSGGYYRYQWRMLSQEGDANRSGGESSGRPEEVLRGGRGVCSCLSISCEREAAAWID
jgi:hypothetical protein